MPDTVYEFGDFQLDPAQKQLRQNGEILSIPPKAFELLIFMVENKGRLLSKNELLERVWADSFVEEGNLKITVHALRKALNAEEFIETVPKYGYRFNADVRTVSDDDLIIEKITQSKLTIEQARQPFFGRMTARTFVLAAVGLVAIATIGYVAFLRSKPGSEAVYRPNTIAVLPFSYVGEKTPETDFMQASLSDALITRFGNLHDIKVRPTSAIRKYFGQPFDSAAAGRDLNVEAVLEGTIRRDGDHVRVTAQLVRVSDQNILWTDTFNESFSNLVFLEDVIASRLTNAMAMKLSPNEEALLKHSGRENPTAYNLYLQGRYYWNKRTAQDLAKSIPFFEQAIAQDQNYALAYSGLADSYLLMVEYRGILPTEGFAKGRKAAQKAIELDDNLAEAHTSLGYIQAFFDWDFPEAERSFKRAIELNPNYATARQWYSEFLLSEGKYNEAAAQLKAGEELDPTSLIIKTDMAGQYYTHREYAKSIEISKKVIEIDPTFVYGYVFLWIAYEQNGQQREAGETLAKIYQVAGEEPDAVAARFDVFHKNGYRALFEYEHKRATDPKTALRYNDYQRAMQTIRLGDTDATFAWLQKSLEARDRWFLNLATDPQWDTIRSDMRFTELLEKTKTH